MVCVIDGSNLFRALRVRGLPTRLHYTRLGIAIAKLLPPSLSPWVYLETTYVTASPRKSDGPERFQRWRRFQASLDKTDRLTLRLGRLEGPRGQVREKGVDTIVTTTLLSGVLRDTYDVAILVSADGDFASAIDEVRAHKKEVFVAFFGDASSYHLRQSANGFRDLSALDYDDLRLRHG